MIIDALIQIFYVSTFRLFDDLVVSKSSSGSIVRTVVIGSVFGLMVACGDEQPQNFNRPTTASSSRIVSLAPALTQMLVDLGVADQLVAVAEHDMAAPRQLPVVGHFTEVNTESLLSVNPDLVLMMAGKEGPPERLRELAATGRFDLVVYPHPLRVADIVQILTGYSEPGATVSPPDRGLGEVLEIPEHANGLARSVLKRLNRLRMLTEGLDKPKVLLLIEPPPLVASGPGTVHDQLLEVAGGVNAAADARVTAPRFDREMLLAMNPQVVLMLLPEASRLDPSSTELTGLPIDAVRYGRIESLYDPLILLPSTSLVRIAVQMTIAIHPYLADEIEVMLQQDAAEGVLE